MVKLYVVVSSNENIRKQIGNLRRRLHQIRWRTALHICPSVSTDLSVQDSSCPSDQRKPVTTAVSGLGFIIRGKVGECLSLSSSVKTLRSRNLKNAYKQAPEIRV